MRSMTSSAIFASSSLLAFSVRSILYGSPNVTVIGLKRPTASVPEMYAGTIGTPVKLQKHHPSLNAALAPEVPRPLREHRDRASLAQQCDGPSDRRYVTLAALDRVGAERADEPAEQRDLEQLRFRHEDQLSRRRTPEYRRIEIRDMVRRDDHSAVAWDVFDAAHPETPQDAEGRRDQDARSCVERRHGRAFSRIRSGIASTTSSIVRAVESIVIASGAGRSGATAREASSRSRSSICARKLAVSTLTPAAASSA